MRAIVRIRSGRRNSIVSSKVAPRSTAGSRLVLETGICRFPPIHTVELEGETAPELEGELLFRTASSKLPC
jgi:hypothetical protein